MKKMKSGKLPRKINDRNLYLKLMSKSFYDKAWFLKNLPDDVETIVDFGGGTGEFAEFCSKITGNHVRYIVIDNDRTFLEQAKARNNIQAFESLTAAKLAKAFKSKTSLLVLSSVIHEVYAYADPKKFWKDVERCKFKYIAIRDMTYDFNSVNNMQVIDDNMLKAVIRIRSRLQRICPEQLKEFEEQTVKFDNKVTQQLIYDADKDTYNLKHLLHLLLKYRYKENWDREVKENYLPLQTFEFEQILSELGYGLSSKITNVKFLIDTWLKDLKLDDPKDRIGETAAAWIRGLKTHIKCFATKI